MAGLCDMLLNSLINHGQVRNSVTWLCFLHCTCLLCPSLGLQEVCVCVCVCVQLVDGVSQLLFEVCRGVKGQLHPCSSKVISASHWCFVCLFVCVHVVHVVCLFVCIHAHRFFLCCLLNLERIVIHQSLCLTVWRRWCILSLNMCVENSLHLCGLHCWWGRRRARGMGVKFNE